MMATKLKEVNDQQLPEGLAKLRAPFPPNQISKLPKPLKKDAPKGKCGECGGYHGLPAIHLDYVGHAALTDRLLDTDPLWSWEPAGFTPEGLPALDRNGGLWIKLTVCGVTRYGYGCADGKQGGDAMKEIIGDALRNAAMRFGAALDLWHKGDLHADDDTPHNTETGEVLINDHQWATLVQLSQAAGVSAQRLCKFFQIDNLKELPSDRYDEAVEKLNVTIKEKTQYSHQKAEPEMAK